MTRMIDTLIVGGGQAGLAASYLLKQRGIEHIVLEQASQAGNAWRNDRWDSFTLVTPNWTFRLPGADYDRRDPHGFMPRQEIVACFEDYVRRFNLPVQYGVKVTAIEPVEGHGYRVAAGDEHWQARNVVVASGLFQRPKLPPFSQGLSPQIPQIHSGKYRNPQALPPGAVLVVGSGQSGCQIAEELYQSGRKVYLCVGKAGRAPRRYRGKDVFEWLYLSGFFDRTVDKLPSPTARFAANPQLSGRDGGHSLNLHQFARDGVTLLGRLVDGRDTRIWLADDLQANLARTDQFEVDLLKLIDGYIAQNGVDAPVEHVPARRDGYAAPPIGELDLASAGVAAIIWAAGYAFDFSLVHLPVLDSYGYPLQQRGVSAYPGLYFLGLPWLYQYKSGLLVGVAEDAEYIAAQIAALRANPS